MSLRILRHLLLPLCALPALIPFSSQALTIGTGPLNGVYYPTGGALCRVLNADNALQGDHCTVQSTQGSMANLKALGKGKVQLALVQSDVLHHALHGSGPFRGQSANHQLRSLFSLYQESLTLLAAPNSRITTLADIEGKRVYPGNPKTGERITSQALMTAMGWQPQQFAAYRLKSNHEPLEGLCNGTLDAAFVVEGHPSLSIGDLINRCKVRLIPIEGEQIDRLLKRHPYYQRSHIAANLYPGQTSSINNIGMNAELVTLASLPDPVVRTVRDTLQARVKQFSRLHPALSKVTPEQLQAQTELPLHPGMSDQPPEPLPLTPEPLMPGEAAATPADRPSEASATASSEAGATDAAPLPKPAVELTPAISSVALTASVAVSTQPQESVSSAALSQVEVALPATSSATAAPQPDEVDTTLSPATSGALPLQP